MGTAVVVCMALLFAGTGSVSLAATFIELLSVPAAVGVTTIFTVKSRGEASAPTVQVTMLLELAQVPCEEVAETKFTLFGRVSVKITPVASCGPWLATCAVYVRLDPIPTGSGVAVEERMAKSAPEVGLVFSSTSISLAVPRAIRSVNLSPLRSSAAAMESAKGLQFWRPLESGEEKVPSPFPSWISREEGWEAETGTGVIL